MHRALIIIIIVVAKLYYRRANLFWPTKKRRE